MLYAYIMHEFIQDFFYEIRSKRLWGFLGVFVLTIAIAVTVSLSQRQQTIQQHASGNAPTYPMAIYTSCGTGSGCLANLDTLSQGGFSEVIDYSQWGHNPSIQNFIQYANKASSVGVKIIWNFKDFWKDTNQFTQEFPAMASSCGCSDNTGFLTYVVTSVKNLPGTWGYYIADETSTGNHTYVKTVADIIHNADPNHPRLYVGNGWTTSAVNTILGTYADTAEVLATDFYPIGNGQDINYTKNLADAVQTVAHNTGKQPAMVLQAHSWNHYAHCGLPYPTTSDMISQMTQALNYQRAPFIIWYSQFDILTTSCGEDNPTLHWNNLVTAIHSNQFGACSSNGGDQNSYPQCSLTTGACLQHFPDKYVVVVHHCNDGTYICPANEARPAIPGECGVPNNTPTPTTIPVTPTPSPMSNTPTPTIANPPISSTPTPTPVPNQTYLILHISVPSIGTDSFSNHNPLHPKRSITLNLFDSNLSSVDTETSVITYDPSGGTFNGRITISKPIGTVASIKLTMQQALPYVIQLQTHLQDNQINILPTIALTTGDINGDGRISILDYAILSSCFKGLSTTCSKDLYTLSDLDDDGLVDGIDYNIFLRNLLSANK